MEIKPLYVIAFFGAILSLVVLNSIGFFGGISGWYAQNENGVNQMGLVVGALIAGYLLLRPRPMGASKVPRVISMSQAIDEMGNEGPRERWVRTNTRTLYEPDIAGRGFLLGKGQSEDGLSVTSWNLRFPFMMSAKYPLKCMLGVDQKKFPIPEGTRFRFWIDARSFRSVMGGGSMWNVTSTVNGNVEQDRMEKLVDLLERGEINSPQFAEASKMISQSEQKGKETRR